MTGTAGVNAAAEFARLKLTYGPRWHIAASIPGTGPRTLTATDTSTGRRVRARNEAELETTLAQASQQRQVPGQPAHTECGGLCR